MLYHFPFLISQFHQLERYQWLPEIEIARIQWQRFKKIIRHAYNHTVFYKNKFDEAGITPDAIRDRNDLAKIPVTNREDLRDPVDLISSGYNRDFLKSSTTSGSTGRRTTTYFDSKAWLLGKYLLKLRARRACGLKFWDRIAILSEEAPKTLSGLSARLFRQKKIGVLDHPDTYSTQLSDFKPTVLYGFPSTFLNLENHGLQLSPKLVFTSSEMLPSLSRHRIESAFGAPVFDIYGSTELKEIAWECPAHKGYHINSDWLLIEYIADQQSMQKGEGSIVITSLYNYGMPLIRYVIGDTGRQLPGECSCGRGLPLMSPGLGRSVDYFKLPDDTLVSPYKMTCAIENILGMKQYQIRQESRTRVVVKVIPGESFNDHNRLQIIEALKKVLYGMTVEVETVETLQKGKNGKYKIVVSLL